MSLAQFMHTMQQAAQQPTVGQRFMQGQQEGRDEQDRQLKREQILRQAERQEELHPFAVLKAQREAAAAGQPSPTDLQRRTEYVMNALGYDEETALGITTGRWKQHTDRDGNVYLMDSWFGIPADPSQVPMIRQGHAALGEEVPVGEEEAPTAGPATATPGPPAQQRAPGQPQPIIPGPQPESKPGDPGRVIAYNPRTDEPITYSRQVSVSPAREEKLQENIVDHYRAEGVLHALMDRVHNQPVGFMDQYIPGERRTNAQIVAGEVLTLFFELKKIEEMGVLTASDQQMLAQLVPDPNAPIEQIQAQIEKWVLGHKDSEALLEKLKAFETMLSRRVRADKDVFKLEGYDVTPWKSPEEREEEARKQYEENWTPEIHEGRTASVDGEILYEISPGRWVDETGEVIWEAEQGDFPEEEEEEVKPTKPMTREQRLDSAYDRLRKESKAAAEDSISQLERENLITRQESKALRERLGITPRTRGRPM